MKFKLFEQFEFDLTANPVLPVAMIGAETQYSQTTQQIHSPINGDPSVRTGLAGSETVDLAVKRMQEAFLKWRQVPPPVRGELVRRIAAVVREHKQGLGEIITWEVGKSSQEAEGEVQEWIDLCDFVVGLSRQLYGLTIASERPGHRLMEQWHPLGPVGVITAFNFPVAVWSWNTMIALVFGDTVLWKPSEQTPLTSLACQLIVNKAAATMPELPDNLTGLVLGNHEAGQAVAAHPGLPLISATGSTSMGRKVAETVAKRLGRSLLELGGNNGLIVTPYEDFNAAIAMNNGVPQGLSSAIFTDSAREAELFLSAVGSDCGLANVNIGTSGAEIGGAFGGEKETGGGRESGSDAWKSYMRRQTATINYSQELPLAQGIRFDF